MGQNDAVARRLMDEARRHLGHSEPGGWYSPEGDCIFYYHEDVPHVGVRLTGLVTVFEALDDQRPVGIQIKGVKSRLSSAEGLKIKLAKYVARHRAEYQSQQGGGAGRGCCQVAQSPRLRAYRESAAEPA